MSEIKSPREELERARKEDPLTKEKIDALCEEFGFPKLEFGIPPRHMVIEAASNAYYNFLIAVSKAKEADHER